MSFLRRIFSPEYRHALAAEAEGDFLSAARSYALCGERGKVADMHLAQARLEKTADGRIRSLRNALAFAPDDKDQRRPMVLRLLARALQERGENAGVATSEGRGDLLESAQLLAESSAHAAAAEIYLRLGRRDEAAAVYAAGGLIERVEEVLGAQEEESARSRRADAAFRDHELLLQEGRRDEALAALQVCVDAAEQKGEYRQLLAGLSERLLTKHAVRLDLGRRQLLVVGRLPLIIGRELDCDFIARGPSVSRQHARILYLEADRCFGVEDCGSRNGTLLNGLSLGEVVALPPAGTLGLGDSCQIAVESIPGETPLLSLEVRSGVDRGLFAVASPRPIALDRLAGPPAIIEFVDGRPLLRSKVEGIALRLNDARVAGPVQLIRGDRVELAGHTLAVLE